VVLLPRQLQRPLERTASRIEGSLGEVAFSQQDLDDHPVGLPSEGCLQVLTGFHQSARVEKSPSEAVPGKFILRMLSNQIALPGKRIFHGRTLTQTRRGISHHLGILSESAPSSFRDRWVTFDPGIPAIDGAVTQTTGRIWPDLAGSGRIWPDLAGSGRIG